MFSPIPRIGYVPHDHYTLAMYALGGTHNLLSLFVLISYFLSNHPRFPTKEEVKAPFRYGQCVNENCSTDADFGIFSVVALQCCFILYIFRAELSVAVEIMVAVRRKATISQRKNLMKFQS